MEKLKIGVIGMGRVGLVTATAFASLGFEVWGSDKDKNRIEKLKRGKTPFFEPGLQELLNKGIEKNALHFCANNKELIAEADVLFLCVGTPSREDGSADLSQVEEVAREIALQAKGKKLIVEKSTVPVKTAQWIMRTINLYSRGKADIEVASNPEFLREGKAIEDFLKPDRIVIGAENETAKEKLLQLYEKFNCPKIVTDIKTAEIIKHASNAFLATKISFINLVADLCEATGADVNIVSDAMGLDRRIGRAFLDAGLGYGGSCLPKDVKAFTLIGENFGINFNLLKEVDRINDSRIDRFLEHIHQALWTAKSKVLGILGLSFKPETDDIRETAALRIIPKLLEEGAYLKLYDPVASKAFMEQFPEDPSSFTYVKSPYESARDAHALLILTDWKDFRELDFKKIKKLMITPIIIDGRNIVDPEEVISVGFEYYPMGRRPWHPGRF